MYLGGETRARLTQALSQAQQRGWIGPQPIDRQIDHSLAFADAAESDPTTAVDLGSGGGLPALVLAAVWPQSHWTLVEASLARAAFLELRCAHLGWSDRMDVVHGTAEILGEDEQRRGRADLVTARSFGPPLSVIKAAAPLLRPGRELIVSAAPDATPWPADALAGYGLGPDRLTQSSPRFHRSTRTPSLVYE